MAGVAVALLVVVVAVVVRRGTAGARAGGGSSTAPVKEARHLAESAAEGRAARAPELHHGTAPDVAVAVPPVAEPSPAAAPTLPWLVTVTVDAVDDVGKAVADGVVELILVDHPPPDGTYVSPDDQVLVSRAVGLREPAVLGSDRWPGRLALVNQESSGGATPNFYLSLGDAPTPDEERRYIADVAFESVARGGDALSLHSPTTGQQIEFGLFVARVEAALPAAPDVLGPAVSDSDHPARRIDVHVTLHATRWGSAQLVAENLGVADGADREAFAKLSPQETIIESLITGTPLRGRHPCDPGSEAAREYDPAPNLPSWATVEEYTDRQRSRAVASGVEWPTLAPGTYNLGVRTTWGRQGVVEGVAICPGMRAVRSVKLEPTPSLHVTVVDGDSESSDPIAGAEVAVSVSHRMRPIPWLIDDLRTGGASRRDVKAWAERTDAEGTTFFSAIGPTRAWVDVTYPGWAPASVQIPLRARLTSETIQLHREPAHVVFLLSTDSGGPLPALAMSLHQYQANDVRSVDAVVVDGKAEADLDPGAWQLHVRYLAPEMREFGYTYGRLDLRGGGARTVPIVVPGPIPVTVLVTRAGTPAVDERLTLTSHYGNPGGWRSEQGTTGDDGVARFELLEGRYVVEVNERRRTIHVAPGADNHFEISLTGRVVEGVVLDASDGAPLGGVDVVIRSEGPAVPHVWSRADFEEANWSGAATTGPDGVFRFEPVDMGRVYLCALRDHYAPLLVPVEVSDEMTPVTLRMSPGGGRIFGSIKGEEGEEVWDVTFLGTFSEDSGEMSMIPKGGDVYGEYSTEYLTPGRYRLLLLQEGYRDDGAMYQPHWTDWIDVAAGAPTRHDVVMKAAGGVRIRVVDVSGVPVSGARLTFQSVPESATFRSFPLDPHASTDFGGAFSSERMPPGTWRFVAEAGEPRGRTGRSDVVTILPHTWTDVTIVLGE